MKGICRLRLWYNSTG